MKTIIFIIGFMAGLMGPALAQTNQPESSAEVTNEISSDALTSKLGTVYHKYRIEKADPAGLTISYVPDGGGLGMERVPFSLLPDGWQRRYGYNPEKAAKFDLEQKKAMAQLREQMIAEENAYREKRAREEAAEEAAAAQAKIEAETARLAAEAAATNSSQSTLSWAQREAAKKKAAEAAATQTDNPAAMTDTNPPAPPSPRGGY